MPLGRTLLLVVAVGALVAGGGTSRAVTTDEPWPTFVRVTRAEKRATRPLADAVATAYRSGRFSVLCSMFSRTDVERAYGSVERCRRSLSRSSHPCSNRCGFRFFAVVGAYLTPRDKALRRKTLAWVYVTTNPMRRGKGELEIRFRKERGRWILMRDIIETWSA